MGGSEKYFITARGGAKEKIPHFNSPGPKRKTQRPLRVPFRPDYGLADALVASQLTLESILVFNFINIYPPV